MVFAFSIASLRADTIIFKNGDELEGQVLEKDENALTLKVEYGTILVPMSRVKKIEADTLEKVEERAKKRAVAAELAAQMKEDGKVLYKGEWITEEEKKAKEDKIAAAKKKKKESEDEARKKAAETVTKAKLAAEQAAAQLSQNQATTNTRDDRFSQRHSRSGLTNDTFNQSGVGSSGSSTLLGSNGYRGGR